MGFQILQLSKFAGLPDFSNFLSFPDSQIILISIAFPISWRPTFFLVFDILLIVPWFLIILDSLIRNISLVLLIHAGNSQGADRGEMLR
jgi:hypothetical protein